MDGEDTKMQVSAWVRFWWILDQVGQLVFHHTSFLVVNNINGKKMNSCKFRIFDFVDASHDIRCDQYTSNRKPMRRLPL